MISKCVKLFLCVLFSLFCSTVAFRLMTEPSDVKVLLGCFILVVTSILILKSKFFLAIDFKKFSKKKNKSKKKKK